MMPATLPINRNSQANRGRCQEIGQYLRTFLKNGNFDIQDKNQDQHQNRPDQQRIHEGVGILFVQLQADHEGAQADE
jgi:hypothetical protein